MRTTFRRPTATPLVLVAAMVLFAGCGDEGAHLPAGMTGASAAHAGTTGVDVLDDVIDGDPGPGTEGVSTMVDDPILAGYDGLDAADGLSLDDPYSQAINDWNETEGSIGGLDSMDSFDDFGDEGLMHAGYGGPGYGSGYGLGYGYGAGVLSAAAYGGSGAGGLMDAGLLDAGLEDPGLMDPGFEDPGFADPGIDAGIADAGFDPGMVDPGIDAGVIDAGMDVGMVGTGFDAGAIDVGGFDAGMAF